MTATAVSAALKAGRLLKDNFGGVRSIEYKGAVDLVTEMDRASEDVILQEILKVYPDHGILTEESAEAVSSSPFRWIIDPIDGTTNYAHGFPVFCVSIALEVSGTVVYGCVYNPMLDELFTARKGGGAFLNGRPIHVSSIPHINSSLLATGFPYDIRTSKTTNLEHFAAFAKRAQAIRRAGSAALDLSYVACGRFDGFWEIKLNPWDVAAAAIIVIEAGGTITDFKGAAFSMHGNECLASNSLIHDEMLGLLSENL
ncbi:MAG: inositol monophosphatase [Deltaproteobacteria bacterium RIFCSPLOWO2_02_FULL_53_8]|nr:MAG: inositol monophosphatase [Deltaproteobacteria bacterium RIFCSPLOWO2_02_FULL_53_8]